MRFWVPKMFTQEQLRVFNRTVYMTFGCKIHHIVDIVLCKQFVCKFPIANITLNKDTAFVVNIILDGAEISGICKRIKHDYLNVFVRILFVEEILDKV